MPFTVVKNNGSKPVTISASDGDSIVVRPGGQAHLEEKFTPNIPGVCSVLRTEYTKEEQRKQRELELAKKADSELSEKDNKPSPQKTEKSGD